MEKYSGERKMAKGFWILDHKNVSGNRIWKIHYIEFDTEYSKGGVPNHKYLLISLFVWVLMIPLLLTGCDPSTTAPLPRLEIGQEGFIYCGVDTCALTTTEEAWSEHRKALRANDTHGTAALLMAGKLFDVNNRTKALVIDYNPRTALSKVRILEGKETGMAGWAPFEHIVSGGK